MPKDTQKKLGTVPLKVSPAAHKWLKNEQNRLYNATGSEPTMPELIDALVKDHTTIRMDRVQGVLSDKMAPENIVAIIPPGDTILESIPKEWADILRSVAATELTVAQKKFFTESLRSIAGLVVRPDEAGNSKPAHGGSSGRADVRDAGTRGAVATSRDSKLRTPPEKHRKGA